MHYLVLLVFFFFNDTATTEIYTLSLHDALPIWLGVFYDGSFFSYAQNYYYHERELGWLRFPEFHLFLEKWIGLREQGFASRSEEHTSELQSLAYLVCRLLLEKKKQKICATQ